ncbi:1,2-phenylacetyl-CoA epoxidase subunit PaaE [Roseateles oligotrophus]|uniref:Phenylacetate-CoA oxygenase/reductase subunit PaaK n=1 Tax=Roseateles oligotrophus TaxID=1769250 RepID=A0ABT2YBB0_9BURK|nr:1,2-phenylacetyl-CoA epoxidase subunit PaaE [Roseateles oligotrophus]MCV2366872.1 phenylacetate-CoA oxygenase/reductase subunit PaaK [Roseateles oligotrophus]
MSSLHFHPLTVRAITPDTDEAVVVSFDVPAALRESFKFNAGQYLTLRQQINGQDLRRSYSICSAVDDGELRVAVRRVEGGAFSTWVNQQLQPGAVIESYPPQGRFGNVATAPAEARHYVGIAAGSGITPILSLMKTLLAREPQARFTLIYGNRSQASTMFKEEIEDLKNRYMTRLSLHHVFSREHVDSPLQAGRIDAAKLGDFMQALLPAKSIDHVFVCGPFEMNEAAEAALKEAGLPEARIHVERFGTLEMQTGRPAPHKVMAGDADSARVTVIRDGISREIEFAKTDASLLDAAARAGMDMPFSCKSGVCSTCRCKLLEGEVRMDKNFALDKAEVAAGFILSCQAHAKTARLVISFDER